MKTAQPQPQTEKSQNLADYEKIVANRLRAVQVAFGIKTYPDLAAICGTSASVVGNWMSGLNLPRVPEMSRLCDRTGLTLDWIYRGSLATMDPKLGIHLAHIIDGEENTAY